MDDQSENNRSAPPATENAEGVAAWGQPMSPTGGQSAIPPSPGVPQEASGIAGESGESGESGEASGLPDWPSIPDMAPEDDQPTLQTRGGGGDMPMLPAVPPQSAPATSGTPGAYYPGAPSAPLGPLAAPMPGGPSLPPGYPASPSVSPYGYPGNYPGNPSQPIYPGSGTLTPTQPRWGVPLPSGYPAPTYPGAPSAPFAPSMPVPGSWAQAPRQSSVARPLPFGLALLLTVGALLCVALVYIADELLVHGDWADGAHAAGITALGLAGATVVVVLARAALGRRALSMLMLGLLLAAVLAALGVGGVGFSNPLHGLQAQSLERSGDWSGAIYEYQLTGQKGPNAPDIARVYDEWGEQSFQQKAYKPAVERFLTVITQYGQSGAPVDRAQSDLFTTFTAWVQANDPSVPYSDAIADFVAYRANPKCDATCQTSSQTVEAQARYQYGAQLLAQQQYSAAIQQFEVVQSQFSSSPYAAQAHAAAAQAYFALGQQQMQSSCSDAIPTYRTLAKQYGDTPEGAKAKSALAAPQSVTGNIAKFTDPTRVVYLSRHANPSTFSFSQDYKTGVDGHGNFTFHNVAQGNYNLSAASYVSGNFIIYPYWADGNNLYSVQVGPLCPTQVGQLSFGG